MFERNIKNPALVTILVKPHYQTDLTCKVLALPQFLKHAAN